MIWPGALQKTGQLSRLEPNGKDIRPVTVYTHTFVMGGADGRADDREHPFYTAEGQTPQEAEEQARAVYLKAVACTHRMAKKQPMLLECRLCGVQQRTPLATATASNTTTEPASPSQTLPRRKSRAARSGWLGWLRSA